MTFFLCVLIYMQEKSKFQNNDERCIANVNIACYPQILYRIDLKIELKKKEASVYSPESHT